MTRIVERLEGDYDEDEWGFDEGFTELVEPFFGFLYESWWRVKVTAPSGCRRTAARSSPRTTPASSPGTPR